MRSRDTEIFVTWREADAILGGEVSRLAAFAANVPENLSGRYRVRSPGGLLGLWAPGQGLYVSSYDEFPMIPAVAKPAESK